MEVVMDQTQKNVREKKNVDRRTIEKAAFHSPTNFTLFLSHISF